MFKDKRSYLNNLNVNDNRYLKISDSGVLRNDITDLQSDSETHDTEIAALQLQTTNLETASGIHDTQIQALNNQSGSYLKLDGTSSMSGNITLSGHYISNDGSDQGIKMNDDGNIGIGREPVSNIKQAIDYTLTDPADHYGALYRVTTNISQNGTYYTTPLYFNNKCYIPSAGVTMNGVLYGGLFEVYGRNVGTINNLRGLTVRYGKWDQAGNINSAIGLSLTAYANSATTTSNYAILIGKTGAGTISNGYILYSYWDAPHRSIGDTQIEADDRGYYVGAGLDSKVYYDGTDMQINPRVVGDGDVVIPSGNFRVSGIIDSPSLSGYIDNSIIKPRNKKLTNFESTINGSYFTLSGVHPRNDSSLSTILSVNGIIYYPDIFIEDDGTQVVLNNGSEGFNIDLSQSSTDVNIQWNNLPSSGGYLLTDDLVVYLNYNN